MKLNNASKIKLFEGISYIRRVEENIALEYPKGEMRCPVHLSIGQEAVAVGVSYISKKSDRFYSTHRSHAHYLAKGGSLKGMISELYGKTDGCLNGRGGSMHLQDDKINFISSIPIVASSIPLALGSALEQKLSNDKNITVCFLGDGSLEEGSFFESLNFASLNRLPIIFVCENNYYSCYTPLKERQNHSNFDKYAKSFNIMAHRKNGNKIETVIDTFSTSYKLAKKGYPQFLQFDTFRFLEHCGPSDDDHLGYRKKNELSSWIDKCPLETLKKELLKNKILTNKKIDQINKNIDKKIKDAFNNAKKSALPKLNKKLIQTYA